MLGSSIKTNTGHKWWQAPVINEDPENGRNGAFWGVAKHEEFKNLRDEAEFNLVASRSAQAAVIKAIKEGKTNVDLNAPTTPDNTPGGSTPGGSNTGQTGSEGQGSESTGGTTGKDDTGDGLE